MAAPLFEAENLYAEADDGTEILKGLSLVVNAGEIHALMGPNGSGKSTLAAVLLGSPQYRITAGRVLFKGEDISGWSTDVRSKAGLFMAFQYPQEIPGVSVTNFLRQALSARRGEELSVLDLRMSIMRWMDKLDIDPSFASRHLNEGFSGGEKKRNEVLQLAILEPEFAVLDETDSGLDVDALKIVSGGLREIAAERPALGCLVITHFQRLLGYLKPDFVHILLDGKVVKSGDLSLAEQLDQQGYDVWR